VVARRDGLADRRPTLCPQRRQQDRRLDLRARDRGPAIDGAEGLATDDGQGREGIVGSGVERRAHRAKRFDDTGDRSASQ
jgi:hypothetical protein